ncbi:IS200/IS605 family transposase (plasmid) [Candidatus Bandiella woodruffii]|uniref:IS200/IS605 family transposase n=2 Tax=Candidatus Bandiella euplotis TaxID=1664265 RepID=A0ABZ0UR24_9RICK|nr:IS200/IS605 family transposase [Candidatus Bandiella woodruffii]
MTTLSRKEFEKFPGLKKELWRTEFWTKGYFVSTVGKHGDEEKLRNYVKNQGISGYKQIHSGQLNLF